MFKKRRQGAKQKAFIQHQCHTREYDEGCDNCFNSLGGPKIFHRFRYREWMREVWEEYRFYVQRMKESILCPKNERGLSKSSRPYT